MDEREIRISRKLLTASDSEAEQRLALGSNASRLRHVLGKDNFDKRNHESPWRIFLGPYKEPEKDDNPITKLIAVESAKLREKWLAFQADCPTEERLDLDSSVPSIESVIDLVGEINSSWQGKRNSSRRGAAMMSFHRFCGSLGSHSSLIKILPEGNQYVSIFTGTLNAVIKASVNHERILESFSESLCQISEHIVECKPELELFRTKEMINLVAELYAHIFLYLSGVLDWMMRRRYRRLLDSFKEDFDQRFQVEIAKIRHLSERIRNLAAQISRGDVRALRLDYNEGVGLLAEKMIDIERDIRIGQEGHARQRAEMEYYAMTLERELQAARMERQQESKSQMLLLNQLKSMLQESAVGWVRSPPAIELPPHGVERFAIVDSVLRNAPDQHTVSEVSVSSRHLEDFFHRDRVRLAESMFHQAMVSQQIFSRLGEWAIGETSRILWLDGPGILADDFENPLTMLAAKFTDLADSSGVHIMSYFCELRRGEKLRASNTRETQAFIALLSALIRQEIELVLPKFETTLDMSESRFERVDGTSTCVEDALGLFSDLLDLIPDTTYIVVDGFHWLDDRSTNAYLRDFLDVLRHRKLYVLFTTTGRSGCLQEKLLREERLDASLGSGDTDVGLLQLG